MHNTIRFVISTMIILLSMGCPLNEPIQPPLPTLEPTPDPTPVVVSLGNTYIGTGPEVTHVPTTGYTDLTYTLDLQGYTRDVYFVLTNTSQYDASTNPVVTNMSEGGMSVGVTQSVTYQTLPQEPSVFGIPDDPAVMEFNNNLKLTLEKKSADRSANLVPEPPLYDVVDDTNNFMYSSSSDLIPATCRKVVTDGSGHTLNIWVANDCWTTTGTKAYKVDQAMIDILANKFLVSGANNDIYDWLTNLFDAPWGTHIYDDLIQKAGWDGRITILLYDIGGDNGTGPHYLGTFWSKDNFTVSTYSNSNQRIMFYLDAVLYATPDLPGWDITDYWPENIVSTLAHEFQHMIHFYQKPIVNHLSYNSPAWINEMCSLVSEDFVASKLGVDGPRGVLFSDGTDGSANNGSGRFPMFNYYNSWFVNDWTYDSTSLRCYAAAYAFGSYLARNFGGPEFFRKVMHNTSTNYLAIENELISAGTGETFASVLQKWGAALLLSDITTPPSGYYKYNNGVFDDYEYPASSSIIYRLGSINQFNYYQRTDSGFLTATGPYLFTSLGSGAALQDGSRFQHSSSNIFYTAGTGLTGQKQWRVLLQNDVSLTVVVK